MIQIYDKFTPVRKPITNEEETLKDYPTSVGTITTSAKQFQVYRKIAYPILMTLYKKKRSPFL